MTLEVCSPWSDKERSRNEGKWDTNAIFPARSQKGLFDHEAPYENIRCAATAWMLTARPVLQWAAQNALIKIERYTEASGCAVSEEWIKDAVPDWLVTSYMYCATEEPQLTL